MRAVGPQLYPSTRATARNSTAGLKARTKRKKGGPARVWGTAL